MALVIEMPIYHPARRANPYNLRTSKAIGLECPMGCGQRLHDNWKLYLHLLQHHPEHRDAQLPGR